MTARSSSRSASFESDLSAWTEAQTRALEAPRLDDLDYDNLSGVLSDLAAREERELHDRLQVVVTALLRWSEQVDLRCHGWAASLDVQRMRVDRRLRESPSLRLILPGLIAEAYPGAKARAVLESALFDETFPESCPFTAEEILADGYYPDPYGDDAVRGEGWWRRPPP